jgi:hypothetical protein
VPIKLEVCPAAELDCEYIWVESESQCPWLESLVLESPVKIQTPSLSAESIVYPAVVPPPPFSVMMPVSLSVVKLPMPV